MNAIDSNVKITHRDIVAAYECLLGRSPESNDVIEEHLSRRYRSISDLLRAVTGSEEYKRRIRSPSRSEFFASSLNARSIILKHENLDRKVVPGHVVNYLGVSTDVRYVHKIANLAGVVEGPPIPANWHAEMVEWAAALRAVDLANNKFTVVEVGAGWGCWMVNTAVAAKRRGLRVRALGLEGDPGHVEFAREHCTKNGLASEEFAVEQVLAGATPGVARYPIIADSSRSYGQEPELKVAGAPSVKERGGEFIAVPVVTIEGAADGCGTVDLLHIDIQGGEVDLISGSLEYIRRMVSYMVIGTHARHIDGDLMRMLSEDGWVLEFEKPTTITIDSKGNVMNIMDGTQGWRNSTVSGRP